MAMNQEFIGMALKMTVALSVVLVAFWGAVVAFKKFTNNPRFSKNGEKSKKPIEILSYQSLGPNKGLYLIRCVDQKILVGTTAQGISHVADIHDDDYEEAFKSNVKDRLPDSETQSVKSRFSDKVSEIARV